MPHWAKVVGIVGLALLLVLLGMLTNSGVKASALEATSTDQVAQQNVVYPFYILVQNDNMNTYFITSGGLGSSTPYVSNFVQHGLSVSDNRGTVTINGSTFIEGDLSIRLPWRFRILPDLQGSPLPFGNLTLSLVAFPHNYYDFSVTYQVYNGIDFVTTLTSTVGSVGNVGLDYEAFLSQFIPYYDESNPYAEYTYYCTEMRLNASVPSSQYITFTYLSGYDTAIYDNALYLEEYISGYADGYTFGYDNGSADGYDEGYTDGATDGYLDGYDVGYTYGYTDGSADGYDYGYTDGENKALTNTNWLTRIADTILSLKVLRYGQGEAEVALTVGHILGVLVVVPVLVWFLKLFAGG